MMRLFIRALQVARSFVEWLRYHLPRLPFHEQLLVLVAFVLIGIRVVFPVWHLWDGYALYLYPFRESATCLERRAHCEIDRSRTAGQALLIALVPIAVIIARLKKEGKV
jgi:hypothetical protein